MSASATDGLKPPAEASGIEALQEGSLVWRCVTPGSRSSGWTRPISLGQNRIDGVTFATVIAAGFKVSISFAIDVSWL